MPPTDAEELRHLVVKQRLHELEMAYCRGVDRRDRELLASIYFDDAVEEHGTMYHGPVAAFLDWVFDQFLPRFEITAHYVLNEWYAVDGDRAEGETHRVSYHRPHDGSAQRFAACRTFNRYERRHGEWRIVHRSVVRDWIVDTPFDAGLLGGAFEFPMSRGDATDSSYQKLTLFPRGAIDHTAPTTDPSS